MPYLTAVWVFVALIAVYFEWLGFPLTASLNAYQITWQQHSLVSLGIMFQLMIVIGAISMQCKYYTMALIFFSTALILLLYFPIYAGFVNPQWIPDYLLQSQERLELYDFTKQYFVRNLNTEPTFLPAKKFESVHDQLGIIANMLSLGWYLAVIANATLLKALLKYLTFVYSLPIALVFILSFAVLPVCRIVWEMLQVEKTQNQAIQYLTNLQAERALTFYQDALQRNPVLSHSNQFLINAADAYAISTNQRHAYSRISDAWLIIQQNRLLKNNTAKREEYSEARLLLQAANRFKAETVLEKALVDLSQRLVQRLWKFEALAEYSQGNLHRAMQILQQCLSSEDSLTTRFYLAAIYIQLNNPLPAISLLRPSVDQVAHPAVKADIYCTLGDAYVRARQGSKARAAYINCSNWDKINNYRVIKALSGF